MCTLSNINILHSLHSACYYFSTGGKFHPALIFTQLHALTLVARSYALFPVVISDMGG